MKNWNLWWRQHCRGASTSKHISGRKSVSRSRELRRTTGFSEGDKLLKWSTNNFDLRDPSTRFKAHRVCSTLNWRTTTFRTLIYVGSRHCCWQVILHRTKFWKDCTSPYCKNPLSSDDYGTFQSRVSERRWTKKLSPTVDVCEITYWANSKE